MGVFNELLDAFATNVGVPPVVDKHVLVAHCSGEVDEFHLVVIVDAVVLPQNPAPCSATWLERLGGFI